MLEHTSVCMFACGRMLITFSPVQLFTVCVYTVYYMCVHDWVCVCVRVVPPGSHLREWSAAARLSLPEAQRVDALERERTSECSADESEATPHGPLGIYYNQ